MFSKSFCINGAALSTVHTPVVPLTPSKFFKWSHGIRLTPLCYYKQCYSCRYKWGGLWHMFSLLSTNMNVSPGMWRCKQIQVEVCSVWRNSSHLCVDSLGTSIAQTTLSFCVFHYLFSIIKFIINCHFNLILKTLLKGWQCLGSARQIQTHLQCTV